MTQLTERVDDFATKTCLAGYNLANAGVDRLRDRASNDSGQAAAEYLGIIVVVAAIITVLSSTEIGDSLKKAITEAIGKVGKS